MIRQPIVSGQFYTDDPHELRQQVEALMAVKRVSQPALGVMLPHAGYIYSGAIAGETLATVDVPETVLMIGPNHRGAGHPCALSKQGHWRTPLGDVAVDSTLVEKLLTATPQLAVDDRAHQGEHSLEVLLPFLQVKNPQLSIVPLSLGYLSYPILEQLAAGISQVLLDCEQEVLIVASSDMTHYEPSAVARQKDQYALDALLNLDAEALYREVKDHQISMCGMCAATLMVLISQVMGAKQARLIRYGHSGEVSGDNGAVVGYAGVVVR